MDGRRRDRGAVARAFASIGYGFRAGVVVAPLGVTDAIRKSRDFLAVGAPQERRGRPDPWCPLFFT
jgi:hypothetical protein